jgi:hypothetical protein
LALGVLNLDHLLLHHVSHVLCAGDDHLLLRAKYCAWFCL